MARRQWPLPAGIATPAVFLLAATLGLYLPFARAGFVSIDDASLVLRNALVQEPWSIAILHRIFTTFDPELYVPMTFISYRLDFMLGGLNPALFHLHNIVLHAANVLLVFWFFLQMKVGRRAAFLGALLFAVHPLNVEAVMWVAARKDLLAAFFGLVSLNAFLHVAAGGSKRSYFLALLALLMGLMAKVTILLLPVFFLAFHGRTGQRWTRRCIEIVPFAVLSCFFGIVAVMGKSRTFGAAIPLSAYPLLAAKSTMMTLGHLLLPIRLSPLYPQLLPVTLASVECLVSLLAAVALAVVVLLARRRLPAFFDAALLFAVLYGPSFLTFTKNGEVYVTSDRYVYLASVGVAWIAAVGALALMERVGPMRRLVGAIIVLNVAALSVASARQATFWLTDESLLLHIIELAPGHPLAYNNLAAERIAQGRDAEAEQALRTAIALNPRFVLARMNLAGVLLRQHRAAEAEKEYETAIASIDRTKRIQSDDLIPYYLLAQMREDRGDHWSALGLFNQAAALGSDLAEAQYNLAIALHKDGRLAEAEAAYRRAIHLNPSLADAHYGLGDVLANANRLQEALVEFDAVLSLTPTDTQAMERRDAVSKMIEAGARGGNAP